MEKISIRLNGPRYLIVLKKINNASLTKLIN